MMINRFAKMELNNVNLKQTNLKNKEMFTMKKILTIAITTIMMGVLFTGCGNKIATKATKTKATTKIDASVPTKDDNGNKLTSAQQADISDHRKAAADMKEQTDKWIKLFCSITPQNANDVFTKLDAMGENPYLTDQFKKAFADEKLQLVNYSVDTVNFQKLTYSKTGKQVNGAIISFKLDFKCSTGEGITPCNLFFVPDSKGNMKIEGISLEQGTIKK